MSELIGDDNLYTDEIKFAKLLVNPEKSIRDQTLVKLNKYLSSVKDFNEFAMLKLWKALYYCIWLADKVPIQQELILKIVNLIAIFKSDKIKLLYIQQFFRILFREWSQLDQYRVNKFYSLIRAMLNKMFEIMFEDNWSTDMMSSILMILSNEVLYKLPNGIRYHVTDIYLEELYKITNGEIETKTFIELINPFLTLLTRTNIDITFIDRIYKMLFQKYLTDFSIESNKNQLDITDVVISKTIFKNINTKYLQKLIFDLASEENTIEFCRKKLYQLHKQISMLTSINFIEETYEQLLPTTATNSININDKKLMKNKKNIKVIPLAIEENKILDTIDNSSNDKNNEKKVNKRQHKEEENISIEKNNVSITKKSKGNTSNINENVKLKTININNTTTTDNVPIVNNIDTTTNKIEKTQEVYIESKKFIGEKKGYIFQKGKNGLGYYLDINKPTANLVKESQVKKVNFGKLDKFSTKKRK